MTPDDFDQAAVDLDLHRRAAARCTVSVPHRDADEDVPCSGCLLAAARQLAIPASNLSAPASMGVTGPAAGAPIDGVSGRVPASPPASQAGDSTLQKSNRPGIQSPRAAESGPVRPQSGR